MKHLIVFFGKLCLITAFVLLLLAPRQNAFAAGCTKSWNNSAGGSWSDGAQWTPTGVPGTGDDVCITLNGTYTVTLSGAATINSLTVGGGSGTQTLSLQASLTASHGITNLGTIRFDNDSTLTVNSGWTLTNSASGVINTNGGTATLAADLINNGTLYIGYTPLALSKTNGVYANNGTVTIQGSSHLTMSGSSQTFNQNGGTVTVNDWGTFDISSATFGFGAGTITSGMGSGLSLSNGALNFGTGAAGSGTIHVNGTSTLSGNVPSGFTVVIGNTSTSSLTAGSGFTNSGTILLTSAGCSNDATLAVTSGTLTNAGALNTNTCGLATLAANLTNNGTMSIATNGDTALAKTNGIYTNNGTLTIQGSSHLTMSGSSQTFNQNGGTVTVNDWGTFDISSATFGFGGGTITSGMGSGLSLSNGALNFATGATGSGTIHVNGTSTSSGNVPSGFTVVIGNTSTSSLTAASGFTNSGTILLTSAGCSSDATLAVTSGTLTNAGALNVDNCGLATLAANLTNNGTMYIHAILSDAAIAKTNGVHTNNGDITIQGSSHLDIAGLNQTFSSPGTFSGNGTLHINNGARYSGTGAISTYVVNHGQMGVGGASTGILNITNTDGSAYTQGADGTLNVRIGGHAPGTGFDQLHIAGGASLDGALNVSTLGGFSPNLGDSFQIASCNNCNGTFATVNGAVLSACSQFAVQYANTSVTLVTGPRPCAFLPFIGR